MHKKNRSQTVICAFAKLVAVLLVFLIRVYQACISTLIAPSCLFEVTCSHYAIYCLRNMPIRIAIANSVRRVLSCHPYCKSHLTREVLLKGLKN